MLRPRLIPLLLALASMLALPAAAHAAYATPTSPIEGSSTTESKVPISWTLGACEGTDRCNTPYAVYSTAPTVDAAGRLSFEPRFANTGTETTNVTSSLTPGQYWYQVQWRAFNGAPNFEGFDQQAAPVHFTINDQLTFVKVTPQSFYSRLKKWDYVVEMSGTSSKYRLTTTFAIQAKRKNGRLFWAPAGSQVKVVDHSITTDLTYKEREYLTWSFGNKFRVCKGYKVRFVTTAIAVGSPGAKPRKHTAIGTLVCKRGFI